MQRRIALAVGLSAALFAPQGAASAAPSHPLIGEETVAGVRIGQSLVRKAGPCEWAHLGKGVAWDAPGAKGSKQQVSRVFITNPRYRTLKGAHVGTRLAALRTLYGKRLVEDVLDPRDRPTRGVEALFTPRIAAVKARSGRVATVFYVSRRGVVTQIKLEKIQDKTLWASDDDECGS